MSAWNRLDMYSVTVCYKAQSVPMSKPFAAIPLTDGFGEVLPGPPTFVAGMAEDNAAAVVGAGVKGPVVCLGMVDSLSDCPKKDALFGAASPSTLHLSTSLRAQSGSWNGVSCWHFFSFASLTRLLSVDVR
ncbi:hypothetical protein CUR178_00904 [Leishmania enriettii]|uniref:Uncharacterized protein n=1 Tax=Leishmania enriettii TaxID=5663 RepID=A0A836GZQ4_LEIEN|nr:hypothetical protein CUR178_00904 [Leishmania enriettii]